MSSTIALNDFVEVTYTGKLEDGKIFDTNIESVAKANQIHSPKQKYGPIKICVGEHQILEGIDKELIGKEIGNKYTLNISYELGFGKRDIKKVQLVPLSTFKEHKVKPFKGLQVDFDGQIGIVQRISGGRVMVNFNHPLAGKDLIYEVEVLQRITDPTEKVKAYIGHIMPIKQEHLDINLKDKTLQIALPFEVPESFQEAMTEKFTHLIKEVEKIEFSKKEVDLSNHTPEHIHGPNCNHNH
ncbi:peptidylprolyl isomerase [archaeon]|nr:peptidylprolyl isomerase [archaeon]|tara:strand:+ start:189 stop:911 length:723 start_codon:yes stop_codon:yes gene_type:complete